MSHIFRFNEIALDDVDFGVPKKSSTGRVSLTPMYKGHRMIWQTPPMDAPFGISTAKDDPNRKFLDLSFRTMDKNEMVGKYKDFIETLDEKIKTFTMGRAKELLGSVANQGITKDILNIFYRGVVRQSKDPEKYAPTIRYRIITDEGGRGITETYLNRSTKVPIESIPKGCSCICIVELHSVWFSTNMFGPTFKLHIVRFKPPSKVSGYIFFDDEGDDEEALDDGDDFDTFDATTPAKPQPIADEEASTSTERPPPTAEEEDAL